MIMATGYILPTGAADVERLSLLNQIYGPSSEALLRASGITRGMRVLEVGCGSGNMTLWLARQVGPEGQVTGLDSSPQQVELARRLVQEHGQAHVSFVVADVQQPGLPAASFDLVYCRFVLMHLRRPADALRQMQALVRSGGVVACEELDLSRCFSDPSSAALNRLIEFNLTLADHRGQHFRLGSQLHRLFREVGFARPQCSLAVPAVLSGPTKRLLTLSLQQFAGNLVADGLATPGEIEAVVHDMRQTDADETTLYAMPLMGQVWARR